MLVSLGLLRSEFRLKPAAYEVLAFLPRLLPRRHKSESKEMCRTLKRQLTWDAIHQVLQELDVSNVGDLGYTYVVALLPLPVHAS